MATYEIRREKDSYYGVYETLGITGTLTEARLKAIRLLRKYRWKPDKKSDFTALDIVETASGWVRSNLLIGSVAVNRDGIALWFPGGTGNQCQVIYKNGRLGPKTRFYNGKYDRW